MTVLTEREKEIVFLLAQGKSYGIVARQLFVTRHTVYKHIKNMKEKTGSTTTFDLAMKIADQMKHG